MISDKIIKVLHFGIIAAFFITVIVIAFAGIMYFCGDVKSQEKMSIQDQRFYLMERGFFEGQKKALQADIRIQKSGDVYIWTKSPWDDGKPPVYIPTKTDSK